VAGMIAQKKEDDWKQSEWTNADDGSGAAWNQGAAADPLAGDSDPWAGNDGGDSKPADSWGASKAESWGGSWGNDAAAAPAPAPTGRDYWEAQKYYTEQGQLPGKEEWEQEQDDKKLFQERLGNSGLDFSRYDSVPVEVSGEKSEGIPALASFEEIYTKFGEIIPDPLKQNVRRCKYDKPTPVQKYAIPVGLCGRDIMCCAQTGSGKTAAFLFPVIGLMMKDHANPVGAQKTPFEGKCKPDTLILTPTRELCIQIYEEALKFCHRTDYRCGLIYGGAKPKDQMWEIARGLDVLVATPGRLNDFINRDILSAEAVHVLVLDEADRMLDMGFESQIREICDRMPGKEDRQTMMFSATFPESCQVLAQDFLYNYIWIGVGVIGGAVDTVQQELKKVSTKDKYQALFEVLDNFFENRQEGERVLVFVNAKDTARWLDEQLHEKNYDTGALHGDLTQQERETNLGRFRSGDIDVMIATDVAARGLDIEHVGLVVNYDMPQQIDSYVHRIGRTGRIGNQGTAITFIACDESGTCVESGEVISKLLGIMRDVNCEIPSWFEEIMQGVNQGSWANTSSWKDSWGGKDARQEWNDGKDNGGGNWDKWNKGTEEAKDSWNSSSW